MNSEVVYVVVYLCSNNVVLFRTGSEVHSEAEAGAGAARSHPGAQEKNQGGRGGVST
jgi:hypothetical protein